MSTKGSKRRQRRINTNDEEAEKKVEEIIDLCDDNKSTISTDTEKTDKDSSLKEENVEKDTSKTKEAEETIENGKDNTTTDPDTTEPKPTTNGSSEELTASEQIILNEVQKLAQEDGAGSDLEPLVLDAEDPELQFPSETGSDQSSEKSPTLNRCKTRRSQTRHIPTPKTPKGDLNGEADQPKCKSEVRINVTRLTIPPEVVVTPPEDIDEKPENMSLDNVSFQSSNSDKTEESDLTNASVFVNYTGNDTTRNVDITTTSMIDDTTINQSSNFIESTRDMSYGQTLRSMTGRKGLRANLLDSYRPRLYKSNVDLTSKDLTDGVKKYVPLTPAPSVGVKRKLNRDSPEKLKRQKTEEASPGLFSYISSPFKSKVGRTEIPSSTPKLTSFKYTHQGSTVIDEMTKVGLEIDEKPNMEPKKWCSIM